MPYFSYIATMFMLSLESPSRGNPSNATSAPSVESGLSGDNPAFGDPSSSI